MADGVENIRYTSLFGVTLEARPGQPPARSTATSFTTISNKLVGTNGTYLRTPGVVPIGDIWPTSPRCLVRHAVQEPSFSALVDFQKGGSVHSYSNQWGKYSGTLAETAEGTMREDGVVVDGVYGSYEGRRRHQGNHFF